MVTLPLSHGDVGPDGGAVEFRVNHTDTVDQMVRYIGVNLRQIFAILDDQGCQASTQSHFWMDPWYIEHLPEEPYGKASSLQILGCDPDYSVYRVDTPERPDPRTYTYRTLGGHIHLGMGEKFMSDPAAYRFLIAGLDQLIGTASTYLDDTQEARRRKELYGWAGMVRTEKDRVEYRTLTARALIQTPEICRLMFEAAHLFAGTMLDIYESMAQPEAIATYSKLVGNYAWLMDTIVPAINTHDIDACRTLQQDFADRLSNHDILAVVKELQTYQLPKDFLLHGWETL